MYNGSKIWTGPAQSSESHEYERVICGCWHVEGWHSVVLVDGVGRLGDKKMMPVYNWN